MNSNSREFWKDKAADYKKQLYDLINERNTFNERISEEIEEQKRLTKELDKIKNSMILKQDELAESIKQNELFKQELTRESNTKITKGQKMVLLDYFKILKAIDEIENFSQKNKITLLSFIIDANEKNIEKDFNRRGFNLHSSLNNKSNNAFLVKVFKELKMTKEADWAQKRLEKNL